MHVRQFLSRSVDLPGSGVIVAAKVRQDQTPDAGEPYKPLSRFVNLMIRTNRSRGDGKFVPCTFADPMNTF
ncbi:hypothetical protein FNL56_20170 [Tardiphaga sp. vice304]|uniref:hypothetical protein n=1 Tax=Tardiphaga sp. vice304 TaxID=2592817 RepID=UPI0011646B42|nr:hypothetical protein [Tardiphaga sp. vice304]QDM28186.1 hypothetical protein FNL56_20170 [Tardiphaga sp. vice304]